MINKKFFITLGILLGLVAVLYFVPFFNEKRVTTLEKPEEVSGIVLSKNILNWVNTQRDQDRTYIVGEKCTGKECSYIGSYRSGFSAMWARYNYYKKTGDEAELNILKSDIDIYSNKDIVKLMQNNSWNCYLMYDLYQDSIFDEGYKNKIKNICLNSEYETAYALSNESNELEGLKEMANNLSQKIMDNSNSFSENLVMANTNGNLEEDSRDTEDFFFASSDRIKRYEINKDEKDLKSAIIDFIQGLEKYNNNQKELKAHEGCYVGINSLEYYKTTGIESYRNLSEIIAGQQKNRIDKNSEKDVAICGLFFEKLYKETSNIGYLNSKNLLIKSFVDNNLSAGKNYFYTNYDGSIIKKINYNGLLSELLINY